MIEHKLIWFAFGSKENFKKEIEFVSWLTECEVPFSITCYSQQDYGLTEAKK